MRRTLKTVRQEISEEMTRIADWWVAHGPDLYHDGFAGQINEDRSQERDAEKGCVLNARILWTFSELASVDRQPEYREMADRAFAYFRDHFIDEVHGGVYWSVTATGEPASRRKQTYAQGFAIYGMAAYHHLTGNETALQIALDLADALERHAYDVEKEGYIEAFAEDWSPIEDVRLSPRDLNATKTMNTHLHVLEAYTALVRVHRTAETELLLEKNIRLLADRFIAPRGTHQSLFFDDDWRSMSNEVSFGHDIEASWLLHEALLVLNDHEVTAAYLPHVRTLADAALKESLDAFHEGICELDHDSHRPVRIYEWWCQAEGLVGFLNAYELTGEVRYLRAMLELWSFIKAEVIDREGGEWHAYAGDVPADTNLGYKAGFWKGPYHNTRAMIEVMQRLDKLI